MGDVPRVIELLSKNEETISQLYTAYAEKFPDYRDLWSDLAGQEKEHSRWIDDLCSKIKNGGIYCNAARFNSEAVKSSIKYINEQLNIAKTTDISLRNALGIALDLENSLIEKKYFEVFEGDSAELKQTLLNLAEATNRHRIKIKQALASL